MSFYFLEIWINTLLWFVQVRLFCQPSPLGPCRVKGDPRLLFFLFTLVTQSEGEMGKTELERQRCKRGNSEKSVRGRGVGQKVSTAARDTVENVAWKCSLSCGSLTPAVSPRHAEACLFMHAWDAGGDFFLFLSCTLAISVTPTHPPHSSVHTLSPQATVSDKPFHCHSDSITCELCLPL